MLLLVLVELFPYHRIPHMAPEFFLSVYDPQDERADHPVLVFRYEYYVFFLLVFFVFF